MALNGKVVAVIGAFGQLGLAWNVIVFLLSDEARAVTGALIPVSGRV